MFLLLLALFFSGSIQTVLSIFPKTVLGVILFLTGAQLALGSCDFSRDKGERFLTLVTGVLHLERGYRLSGRHRWPSHESPRVAEAIALIGP